ncbi:MAG: glycosyltransferase family 2 protein [Syntrophaceae bacterium]
MCSFDIILVNYNSTDHLLNCLSSIYWSLGNLSVKIFVEDNASTDGVDRITKLFPEVQLTENTVNLGFAKAVNQALLKGCSPYVILLNPDTIISDNFFEPTAEFMEQNSDVGILGPKILDPDGSVQGSARSFPTPLTAIFGRTSLLTRLFPNNPISRQNILTAGFDNQSIVPVDWVSGAGMIVRRKALDAVGLMDEQFFMYWEDADWCKRMWEAKWKVIYFPVISLTHHVGTSSKKRFSRSAFEFHRSAFNLYRKHTAKVVFYTMLPILTAGLGLRFLLILLRGKKD